MVITIIILVLIVVAFALWFYRVDQFMVGTLSPFLRMDHRDREAGVDSLQVMPSAEITAKSGKELHEQLKGKLYRKDVAYESFEGPESSVGGSTYLVKEALKGDYSGLVDDHEQYADELNIDINPSGLTVQEKLPPAGTTYAGISLGRLATGNVLGPDHTEQVRDPGTILNGSEIYQ